MEVFLAALVSVLGAVAAAFVSSLTAQVDELRKVANVLLAPLKISIREPDRRVPYHERLDSIMQSLRTSSADAQALLDEMDRVVRERAAAVASVERHIEDLERQEQEAAERLERLAGVQPEAARELAALVNASLDRRESTSRRRDYVIFFGGVLVSTAFFVLGLALT